MEDINVIQLLDKIKKNIERGAKPIAISEIDAAITVLERKIALSKGKRFESIHIHQTLPDQLESQTETDILETRQKLNEITRFLNERFPI